MQSVEMFPLPGPYDFFPFCCLASDGPTVFFISSLFTKAFWIDGMDFQ